MQKVGCPRSVAEREKRSASRWETVNVSVGSRGCFLVNCNLGSENLRGRDNAKRGDSTVIT